VGVGGGGGKGVGGTLLDAFERTEVIERSIKKGGGGLERPVKRWEKEQEGSQKSMKTMRLKGSMSVKPRQGGGADPRTGTRT